MGPGLLTPDDPELLPLPGAKDPLPGYRCKNQTDQQNISTIS